MFDFELLLTGTYHDWLVQGLVMSIKLLVISLILTIPVALVVAIIRVSPWKVVRKLGSAYINWMRNVPLLVHMLFWYFGAPQILPDSVRGALYRGNVEATSAIIALVLYTAAYMAEHIRGGIRSIAHEQMEAARSLGISHLLSMRLIILPQAIRVTIPPLISETINLWKNTSIAMVIGVTELLYRAQQVQNVTFKGYEAYGFATAWYILISLMIAGAAVFYQRRYAGKGR